MKRVLSSMIIIALSVQTAWLHADEGSRKNNFDEPAGLSQLINGLKAMPAEQANPILISILEGIDSTEAIHNRFGDSEWDDAAYLQGILNGNWFRFWGYSYDLKLVRACWEKYKSKHSHDIEEAYPCYVRGFSDAYSWGTPVPVLN